MQAVKLGEEKTEREGRGGGRIEQSQTAEKKQIVMETRTEQRRGNSAEKRKRGRKGVGGVTPTTEERDKEKEEEFQRERELPRKKKKSAEKGGGLKS